MPHHDCSDCGDEYSSEVSVQCACQQRRNARHPSEPSNRSDRRREMLDDREERHRMRELRLRSHEMEVEEQEEQDRIKKKGTCKYKTLRCAKITTVMLTVSGLLVMFYILGVIIIDDVSPLEAFSFTRRTKNENDGNLSKVPNNTSFDSNIFNYTSQVNETTKNKNNNSSAEGRSYVAYIPVPLNNEEDEKKDDIEKTEEKKPLLVPVMVVPKRNDNRRSDFAQSKSNLYRSRSGTYPVQRDPVSRKPSIPIRERVPISDIRRPIRLRTRISPSRTRIPLGTRTYVKKPKKTIKRIGDSEYNDEYYVDDEALTDMITTRRRNEHDIYESGPREQPREKQYSPSGHMRHEESPSILSSIYNVIKNPASLFYSGNGPRASEEEGLRKQFAPYPQRYRERSRSRYHRRPLTGFPRSRRRLRYKRPNHTKRVIYRIPRTPNRRPPREYQYPSSAGNIQEIIDYMDSKEVVDTSYRRKAPRSRLRKHKTKIPNGSIVGTQDHVIGHNIYAENHGYTIKDQDHVIGPHYYEEGLDDIKIETADDVRFGSIEETQGIDHNEYEYDSDDLSFITDSIDMQRPTPIHHGEISPNVYQSQIPVKPAKPIENNYLPIQIDDVYGSQIVPIRNTYDVTKERSSKPFSIMMDVYPKEEIRSHQSRPYQTIFTLGNQNRQLTGNYHHSRDTLTRNHASQESRADDNKHQILLHINLYSRKPSQSRSSPSSDHSGDMSLSLNLPIGGSMSPLDIYRAVVAQARQYPRASAHTKDNDGASKTTNDEAVEIELFDVEDGPQLYLAIEQGLRELNPSLPKDFQFNIPREPISTEKLYEIGTNSKMEDETDRSDLDIAILTEEAGDMTELTTTTMPPQPPEILPKPC